MSDAAGDPVVGVTLAGYRIERRLGRGGMSIVYLAEDLALGRRVALKVLAPELSSDPRFRARLRLESRIAASIDHPNVIPIYDAGEADGQFYIAMRYVEGTDLRRLIDEEGALEPERAVELIARVADGLEAAHERGLVHRDVKPSNVLIAGAREREHVYLADFGLTKTADAEHEPEAVQLSGTTDYVAPELITEGAAGRTADVYALGCVLYEALTGRVPYPRSSELETLVAHVDDAVPRPSDVRPDLPDGLDAVVERAMAKAPADRYASAAELAAAARETLPAAGRPRRVALALAAAATVLAGAALALVLVTRDDGVGLPTPTTAVTGSALQLIDPTSSELRSTVTLLDAADDVVATEGSVWVIDSSAGTVTRLDPESLEQSKITPKPLQAEGIGVGFGRIWTTANQPRLAAPPKDSSGRGLTVGLTDLDPRTLEEREVRVREHPHAFLDEVAASSEALWAIDIANRTLERVDRRTSRVTRVELPRVPTSLASFGRHVWVAQPRTLSRFEAATGRLIEEIRLSFAPSAIAASRDGVWLADRQGDAVRLYDPQARRMSRIAVGDAPLDVAADERGVWVVNGGDGTVSHVNPETKSVVDTIDVGASPVAVAVDASGVWVAVRGRAAGSVHSFPRVFAFGAGLTEFRGMLPGRLGARCDFGLPVRDCFFFSAGVMHALDGTEATFLDALREMRVPGRTIRCRGKLYRDRATSNIRGDAGKSIVQVDGWGTLVLTFDRAIGVFPDMIAKLPGVSDCGELSGRWFGTSGRLSGTHGTWGDPTAKLPPGSLGGVELFDPPR